MNYENGFPVWDAELERELCTPEEIAENDLAAKIMIELIEARKEQGITQEELERRTGLKQPAIARLERGGSVPTLKTLSKLLAALGKTIEIVPATK